MHALPGSREPSRQGSGGLVQDSRARTCAAPYPWGFRGSSLRRPAPHGASLAAPALSLVVRPGRKSLVALAAARGPTRAASSRSCGRAGTPPSASAPGPGLAGVTLGGVHTTQFQVRETFTEHGLRQLLFRWPGHLPLAPQESRGLAPIHHPRWAAFRLASWEEAWEAGGIWY